MRVKKFEAKSMKEALQMVKTELGPDAVILSAKDHKPAYGLGGDGSVEVTAAVSESTYQKKTFVESRMTTADRDRFRQAQARDQKAVIQQMVESRLRAAEGAAVGGRPASEPPRRAPATISYIDIQDDEAASSTVSTANDRIRAATKSAVDAWTTGAVAAPRAAQAAPLRNGEESQIEQLRKEVQRLERLVMQKGPAQPETVPQDAEFMRQRLNDSGVSPSSVESILSSAVRALGPLAQKKASLDAWVGRYILDSVKIQSQPSHSRVHLFVGPPGSGKTSTLIKMAADLALKERKRVAILSTDSIKLGAAEQLRTYSQLLNVPFALIRNRHDWEWILKQANGIDHLLVDYPGLQLREIDEIQALKSLLPPTGTGHQTHLVMSAAIKDSDAQEITRRFQALSPSDLIFTGLDISVQHGVIWNVQAHTGLPLHSFGIGRGLPEDFEYATKERVLDLLFKLTRVKGQDQVGELS
jgi:flagellar biosynthesis protein FlhF